MPPFRGRRVEDDGPKGARVVLVGEAPGEREAETGRPFVGAAGFRLREWMEGVGLRREEVYITNTYPYRPPGNKLAAIPAAERAAEVAALHDRLAALPNVWVIVPMGNAALEAVTGKVSITKYRGSILAYTDRRGRQIKVIPTIHPAATFRQPGLERACRHDWARVAQEAASPHLHLPQRDHQIAPTMGDLQEFLRQREVAHRDGHREILSVDIENPKNVMTCIGFSVDPSWSLTIPVVPSYWGKRPEVVEAVWGVIKRVCEGPWEKVLQNGLYDHFHLQARGIQLAAWWWDTLWLHHVLDPADDHDLAYMASIFTREPYWKDEAKDPQESAKYTSNWAAFLTYNGKDACVTRELWDVLAPEVEAQGLMEFYFRHYVDAIPSLADLTQWGIRVDEERRVTRLAELMAERIGIEDRLEAITGRKLYAKKGLSTAKLQAYLYGDLGLPKQMAKRKDGETTVTTGEVTVRKLMVRYPEPLKESGPLILAHRRVAQLATFYKDSIVDADGRMRSRYGLNTEEGRSNSGKNPTGSGRSAQNIDREARDLFLADDGCVGVEVDASQIESRFVYTDIAQLTGDRELLDKARARPTQYDQHTDNAIAIFSAILGKPLGARDITKEQRFLGKKVSHAAQRGMQGKKLAEELLKDGYVYSAVECQALVEAYLARLPGLAAYFRAVRRTMIETRMLENSWGRRILFPYDRLNDETFRRGYSFGPQSECFDRMEQFGLIPFYREQVEPGRARLNAFVHDSLWFSVRRELAWEVTQAVVMGMERSRVYRGVDLAIPCEVMVGRRWKADHEWKQMPGREEFDAVVRSLL